jgi:hypothetical protein
MEESRRRVAALGREMRSAGIWKRLGDDTIRQKSWRFLKRLRRDKLFLYLDKKDQKHFEGVLKEFSPAARKKARGPKGRRA